MTNGRERWGCVFLLFLLVFSLPAAALSRGMANNGIQDGLDDSDNENAFLPPHPPNPVLGIVPPAESVPLRIQLQTSPSGAPACRLSQLTPSEVQAFKDTILTSGFQGEEISAGTPPNLNRETVADENTLIVPDPARNGTAIQKEVPTQFLEPEELSPLLNKHIKNGTFAFGLSMTDSLRTARCLTPEQCAVSGEMLRLRNSGEGFTGNIQNMWSSIKGDLGKPDSLFSEEEADYLLGGVEAEQELGEADANYIPVEGFSRIPSNELMNWIAVDNTFSSALLTNCTDSSCITMLYSMFDKYFNAWFSGEMVIGTFGPTAWGKLRYMITRGKRINLISANWADPLRRNIDLENRWKFRNIEGIGLGGNKPIAPSEFFSKRRPGGTIEGKEVFKNYKRTMEREVGSENVFKEFFVDRKVISPGKSANFEDEAFRSGALSKITDFDEQKKLFTYMGKIREHAMATKHVAKQLDDELKLGRISQVDYARGYSKIAKDLDDVLNLDMPAFIRGEKATGLQRFQVIDVGTGQPVSLTDGADGAYFNNVFDEFIKTGNFNDVRTLKKVGENIELYELKPQRIINEAVLESIEKGEYADDVYVLLSDGVTTVPATKTQYKTIFDDFKASGIKPRIVEGGRTLVPGGLSPELFGKGIVGGDVLKEKIKWYHRNVEAVHDTMISRDWGRGNYTNLLSRSMQGQEKLIKNYVNVLNPDVAAGPLGWTAKTYGYWWVTRGLGFDDFTLYRLPDEFTEIAFSTGDVPIYDDAYIDFFANEGSDTGDLFQRLISKFPFPALVIDPLASRFEPLEKAWNFFSGKQARTQPDNLALFMFGGESCPTCKATIASPSLEQANVYFQSPESLTGFLLEDGQSKDARELGQLLVAYAHHLDIGGQLSGEVLDQITLSTAREKGLACDQVIEDVFLWGNVSKLIGAERIGAALAVTENLSYWVLGYGGTLVTAINQIYFAQQMNECVDDKEGYFAHIFVPREVEGQGKSQEIQNSATQEALDGIQAFAGRVQADATDASLSDKALAEATGKVKELVDDARKRDVVEAELRISGASYGGIESKKPIYFWVGPQAELDVSAYSTDGKTVLSNADGDTLTLDNQSGTLTVNGQPVIDSSEADHVRLASTNLSIPAVEVPQRLNAFSLDDSNRFILGINVRGETIVHDPALLDCIRQAVLFQSGVPLNSPVMSEAFGVAETVVTDAYPTISFDPTRNRIVMAGLSAQTASGAAAGVQLFADRTVLVTGAPNPRAGNLNSIIFENGSLVYKPATHELIIWLKHHANAIVSDQEVKDFSGTLTSTSNPTTLCEEPAIDLRVETDPSTPATKLKGDNLTAGLQKNGPFQVFETETKRFILYSKLVEGECKDFFKVIDKLTGEEYDQEINSISQTEDGTIRIQTKDGLDHTLKISDENGKPVLTYDGKSEVLRSASGRGGSFYYDPNRGLYFAENAQFIPLNDQFRNQGLAFQANPDGTASGKAASNVFNINTGQGAPGLFNIPSLPPTIAGLAIALLVLGIVSAGIYVDSRRRKDNEVSSSLV